MAKPPSNENPDQPHSSDHRHEPDNSAQQNADYLGDKLSRYRRQAQLEHCAWIPKQP